MSIRLVIADDHQMVRQGVRALLSDQATDIEIVGEAADGFELLEILGSTKAEVAIVDISMPRLSGIEAIQRLRSEHPDVHCIAMSMYDDKHLVEHTIGSGARGYVLKDNSAVDLIEAIRTVADGKFFVSPSVTGIVVEGYLDRIHDNASNRIDTSLSSRQREMVEMICGGDSVKDIARKLDMPVHTVKVHRQNIMRILDAKSTTELLKQAIRRGIVQI